MRGSRRVRRPWEPSHGTKCGRGAVRVGTPFLKTMADMLEQAGRHEPAANIGPVGQGPGKGVAGWLGPHDFTMRGNVPGWDGRRVAGRPYLTSTWMR